MVIGQVPAPLELTNTTEKNLKQTKGGTRTHISHLTQFMPPPETYKSEVGSQPTMCQVHTGGRKKRQGKTTQDKRKQAKEKKTVVVLTSTRIIKSVFTEQASVTLELSNTPGKKKHKPKVVHAYITAVRPFLIQSDSASRRRPFPTGLFSKAYHDAAGTVWDGTGVFSPPQAEKV